MADGGAGPLDDVADVDLAARAGAPALGAPLGNAVAVIHKTAADWRVAPNLTDYDAARAAFDWTTVPNVCAGMGGNGCNIAYAAVDRHADGPTSARTALRFVTASDSDGALVTRDTSYAELGRLARRFTNVLRAEGISDFSPYSVDPQATLAADFFLPEAVLAATTTRLRPLR